jgi:hypothetical protein
VSTATHPHNDPVNIDRFIGALQDSGTNDPMIDQVSLHDWLQLVRAEYEELPDLRLTPAEVEQLMKSFSADGKWHVSN